MIAIRPAMPADVPVILRFVHELAVFEREPEAVRATEAMLAAALFGDRPAAEAALAEMAGEPVGFALFFHNFSTWEGRRGLYLEDLYVTPAARGQGAGAALLRHLGAGGGTRLRAVRMVGAGLERGGHRLLPRDGRGGAGGMDGAARQRRCADAAGRPVRMSR